MRSVIYVAILVSVLLVPISSFSAGGESCGLYLIFDKYEFSPNEEIPVRVKAVCDQDQGRTATIIVSDGNNIEIKNKFAEEKLVVNKFAEAKIMLPDSDNYRFLVTLVDGDYISDQVIIFTKEGASKLIISDLNLQRNLTTGEQSALELTVTDGIGNAVPTIDAAGYVYYKTCIDGRDELGFFEARLSRSASKPSLFTGIVNIPEDASSGTYNMTINADGGPRGYQSASIVVQVNVLNDGDVPVTKLFQGVHEANKGFFGYTAGDTILLQGRTMTDGCITAIPDVEIFGEFRGTEMSPAVIQNQTKSDVNGNFAIEFPTDPHMPLGELYKFTLKAKYDNKDYEYYDFLVLSYIKKFKFEADGKESYAEVQVTSPDTSIASFTLDKDAKKLVLITKTPHVALLRIAFPPDLLSGDIIVQKDGNETLILSGNEYYNTLTGPWTPEGYSLPYSYHLSAYKGKDSIEIDYRYQRLGESKLEITGTSIIPEFPVNLMIISAITLTGMLVAVRVKNHKLIP